MPSMTEWRRVLPRDGAAKYIISLGSGPNSKPEIGEQRHTELDCKGHDGSAFTRKFPSTVYRNDTEDLEVETFYDDGDEVVQLLVHVWCPWALNACVCGRFAVHVDSVVIAVDGACPGNGSPRAMKSACGIYFGPYNEENKCWRVPNELGHPHRTNQRAELHAAIGALRVARKFAKEGGQTLDCGGNCPQKWTAKHIVIKSDSAYLVNGITEHVIKWEANGWVNAAKKPVANRDLWLTLLALVEGYEMHGLRVDFWHVRREHNREADALANEGLTSRNDLVIQTLRQFGVDEEDLYYGGNEYGRARDPSLQ